MCGFAGFIDFEGHYDLSIVKAMADTLVHRGPDDQGYEFLNHGNASIGLGFRRLSIIDLSPAGHQPMFSPDGNVVIMLNGEIYNYQELRLDLEAKGCKFVSGSDTEVVLQSYIYYGVKSIDKFIGMFAIVLVDKAKGKLFLIRDRAGVKPLFYHQYDKGILFASELKAFHKHPSFKKVINRSALKTYFLNGNIPAPETIFEQTFKVAPGYYIEIDIGKRSFNAVKYWDVFDGYNLPQIKISYEEALTETENLLSSAFNYRMVADVPVGVFLSGGYDSSAVAAILSKNVTNLNTFTIGFDDKAFDESPHAKIVARHLGTNHHEYFCTTKEAMDILPDIPEIYDEPFGDSSAIPTTLVSRIARKHVTVALSADAGDELFAGYPRHQKIVHYLSKTDGYPNVFNQVGAGVLSLSRLNTPSISKADIPEKLRAYLGAKGPLEKFHIVNQTYTEKEINRLVKGKAVFSHLPFNDDRGLNESKDVLNKILAVEYKTYLVDDILQKVDRATMSASLEGREPFLDHRLVEWLAVLPSTYKLNEGVSKRLLKDIVHKYIPKEMMIRPKMGFGIPVKNWLKNELRELFEEIVDVKFLKEQDLLNSELVLELKKDYLNDKLHDFERLWFVFIFLQWYKKWMF